MVKTTKILLIFLQTFEGNVGKKIFFGVFVGKEENRKGAIKPWPLCTPLGLFFRSSWVVVWGTVLTFVCMLRYWMRNVVPRGLQWNCNEVLDVRCTSAGLFLLPSAIFRLSVELPVQKHTGTS